MLKALPTRIILINFSPNSISSDHPRLTPWGFFWPNPAMITCPKGHLRQLRFPGIITEAEGENTILNEKFTKNSQSSKITPFSPAKKSLYRFKDILPCFLTQKVLKNQFSKKSVPFSPEKTSSSYLTAKYPCFSLKKFSKTPFFGNLFHFHQNHHNHLM